MPNQNWEDQDQDQLGNCELGTGEERGRWHSHIRHGCAEREGIRDDKTRSLAMYKLKQREASRTEKNRRDG
jgi:hypothetical protein